MPAALALVLQLAVTDLRAAAAAADDPAAAGGGGGLHHQLGRIAAAGRFPVHGLGYVAGEPARPLPLPLPPGAAGAQALLKAILQDFDYLVVSDAAGGIAEVRILGRSRPRPMALPAAPAGDTAAAALAAPVVVPTRRDGGYHQVDAQLTGPNRRTVAVALVLDTGATTVVLPRSMMAGLGFRESDLVAGWAATAGGRVPVWNGVLPAVAVGGAGATAVAVSFLDDHRLGVRGLLGMSFLSRFTLTVDDAAGEITLLAR